MNSPRPVLQTGVTAGSRCRGAQFCSFSFIRTAPASSSFWRMVRAGGIEPPRVSSAVFEAAAPTDFATPAHDERAARSAKLPHACKNDDGPNSFTTPRTSWYIGIAKVMMAWCPGRDSNPHTAIFRIAPSCQLRTRAEIKWWSGRDLNPRVQRLPTAPYLGGQGRS